jgi:hypothetical protein
MPGIGLTKKSSGITPRKTNKRIGGGLERSFGGRHMASSLAGEMLVVEHERLFGGVAHLFDRDRVEVGEKGLARPAYGRIDHTLEQDRV